MVRCCDITTADLRTRIYVERRVRTSDGMGGWTEAWVADPASGVWAKFDEAAGSERDMASRIESYNLGYFTVRFRGDSLGAPYWDASETRVRVRGRYYNVLSIVDIELKQKWLRLFCQEGDAA